MEVLRKLKDPDLCREVLEAIRSELHGTFRFMEVCGTHTVAIFQSGLRSLLPEEVIHLSGPGCPVCVTHESEVATFIEAAEHPDVILATFGDLMRVPGPGGKSLKQATAEGASIKVVYSPTDALKLAHGSPNKEVIFLGVGFETTAPTVAGTVKMAQNQGLQNFSVLSFHKLVPPALEALVGDPDLQVEGFLLPGHVSTIIGTQPYKFLAEKHNLPAVVSGFEPLDILQAILLMMRQKRHKEPSVVNNYKRVVSDTGNSRAREIMYEVFQPADALWRGIGNIPQSGLVFSEAYSRFDAMKKMGLTLQQSPPLKGCRCGEVLKGILRPDECPLFKKVCTPAAPVGPCMVSTEGSCAAYYKYQL